MPDHVESTESVDALRRAGLRVTDSRRAVHQALRQLPHARADEVYAQVLRTVPGTSLQSVYNALADFVTAGVVRQIEPAGHPRLFELRVDDNHHHMICTSCGAVEDVDCAVGSAPCLTPSESHGYAVRRAEVTYWGICPRCSTDNT